MVSHQFPQIDIQILTSQVLFLDNSIIPLLSFHYQSLFSSSQLLCPALPTWKLLWPMPLTDFFHCPPVASLSLTSSHFLWKIETILVLILLIHAELFLFSLSIPSMKHSLQELNYDLKLKFSVLLTYVCLPLSSTHSEMHCSIALVTDVKAVCLLQKLQFRVWIFVLP